MTPDAIIRTWFKEVWTDGDLNAVDRLLDKDGIAHDLPSADGGSMKGPEAFRSFVQHFRGAFPDMRIEVLRTVTEGPLVCAHCRVTGTHTGPGFGPPTGKPIDFSGMTIGRMENGRIKEGWNSFDFMSMFQQIQLLPKI
jgi:steroid delta-isomerase-like uncharacterized protein